MLKKLSYRFIQQSSKINVNVCIDKINNSLNKIFTGDSIKERIQQFKHFQMNHLHQYNNHNHLNTSSLIIPQIQNPSYLSFCNARALSHHIKHQKIAPNIRILHALSHIQYNAFTSYCHTYFNLSYQIQNIQYRKLFEQEIKKIALDQGQHFCLLTSRLQQLGYKYGQIPVIDQLCRTIEESRHSLLDRLAKISLLHQGRGMKAIKKLISQLQKQNDTKSIQILKIIQKQQVYHFQNGVKWFYYLCCQQNKSFQQVIHNINQKSPYKLIQIEQLYKIVQKYQLKEMFQQSFNKNNKINVII